MKDNAQKPKHGKHLVREEHNEKYNDVLVGRNCVREALKSGRTIDNIIIAKGNKNGSLGEIITLAKNKGIPVKEADSKKLDFLSKEQDKENDKTNIKNELDILKSRLDWMEKIHKELHGLVPDV